MWQYLIYRIKELSSLTYFEYIHLVGHYNKLLYKEQIDPQLLLRGFSEEQIKQMMDHKRTTVNELVSCNLHFKSVVDWEYDHFDYVLTLFNQYNKHGTLPFPGSHVDQPAKIIELFEVVDEYVPEPERDTDKPFLMPVEDVFTITGRGTVATGRVERGQVRVGDPIEIVGITDTKQTVVTGVEMFRKLLDYAEAGDNIGALLRGINREQVERGQVLAKPKSVNPHFKFEAQVYVLSKEEGGRHTAFFSNYRPQFYFRTTDVTGVITLQEGTEMVMPGDNTVMNVELIHPIAIEEGTKFSIREGGRTVGAGSVVKIIE